jgi:hypothetical protein
MKDPRVEYLPEGPNTLIQSDNDKECDCKLDELLITGLLDLGVVYRNFGEKTSAISSVTMARPLLQAFLKGFSVAMEISDWFATSQADQVRELEGHEERSHYLDDISESLMAFLRSVQKFRRSAAWEDTPTLKAITGEK